MTLALGIKIFAIVYWLLYSVGVWGIWRSVRETFHYTSSPTEALETIHVHDRLMVASSRFWRLAHRLPSMLYTTVSFAGLPLAIPVIFAVEPAYLSWLRAGKPRVRAFCPFCTYRSSEPSVLMSQWQLDGLLWTHMQEEHPYKLQEQLARKGASARRTIPPE